MAHPTPRPFDPETLAFYAREAPVYIARGKSGEFKHLEAFLEHLAPRASILELGCGGGRDAEFMLARGFRVDATDGVAEMAAKAEARIGQPVRVMRFDELNAVGCYDAVVAAASLLHVPRSGLADVLARVWRALRPGGWHIASFKTGGEDGYDEHGRYYNRPSADFARAIYEAAGSWATLAIEKSFLPGYLGKPSDWLTIEAQKEH